MNTDPTQTRGSKPRANRSEWVGLLAIVSPMLLLGWLLALGLRQERTAHARVAVQLARMKREGKLTGSHDSNVSMDQRLSNANSQAWQDVIGARLALSNKFGHLIFAPEFEQVIPSDQPWSVEPAARRYTDQAKPIIDLIEKLVIDEEPVWQPLIMDGYQTLLSDLQEARGVTRLLAAEFRVAVHQNDHARAIRALKLILGVSRAFDWQICLVSDLMTFSHRRVHRSLIRQSLEIEFWKDEQDLRELRAQLSPRDDYDSRWQQAIASEWALAAGTFVTDGETSTARVRGRFPFGAPATSKTRFLETIPTLENIGAVGTIAHAKAFQNVVERQFLPLGSAHPFAITGMPYATYQQPDEFSGQGFVHSTTAFARDAMERRWTLTAVAIKQFQVQQGRWPNDLSELSGVELPKSDTIALEGQPLGYAVGEQGAILWTPRIAQGLSRLSVVVPAAPPGQTDDPNGDPNEAEQTEIHIK